MTERVQFDLFGRVQGVAFRYFTQVQAKQIGITGYVQNRDDGSVRVIACGEPAQIKALRQWLQHGPSHACVTRIDETVDAGDEMFKKFSIRY